MTNNEKDNNTGRNHAGDDANRPMKILTAASLKGDRIFNNAGEYLGKIKDVMLNLEEGKIEYFVITFGGYAGINRKYLAVPFEALRVDTKRHAFILDKSLKVLSKMRGFNKRHWPFTNSHVHADYTVRGSYGGFMGSNTGTDY